MTTKKEFYRIVENKVSTQRLEILEEDKIVNTLSLSTSNRFKRGTEELIL